MIKVVSFDIGGTLIKPSGGYSLPQALSRILKIDVNLITLAYRENFVKNKGSLEKFCIAINYKNYNYVAQIITEYYAKKPIPSIYNDVIKVIREIKRLGYTIISISNKSFRDHTSLASYGLKPFFNSEIYSYEVGCIKPDVNIFKYAENCVRAKPEEIIHIGDNIRSDVQGANNAHWHSVLIQRKNIESQVRMDIFDTQAEYVIDSLESLPAILKSDNIIGLLKDNVALCVIDKAVWQKIFKEEKARISKLLEGKFVSIEHVGSTAIPNIMAKPIVDIAIGIKDMNNILEIKRILEINGYKYRPERGSDGRFLFIKTEQTRRTHHLHVEEYGKDDWNNHLQFRDCLLNSQSLQAEYETLKKQLAQQYPRDRERYTMEKATFIQKVLSEYRSRDSVTQRENHIMKCNQKRPENDR